MHITDLRHLLTHELHDLHSAEKQIIDSLPIMINSANSEKLKSALQNHLEVTREQLRRLELIDGNLSSEKDGAVCVGIKGILSEAQNGLASILDVNTKDAAIIASAQKVEHYEIAAYGSAAQFARQLELNDVADELEKSLKEEKEADQELSSLAEGGIFSEGINKKAITD